MKFKKILAGALASMLTLTTVNFYVSAENDGDENNSIFDYGDYLKYRNIDEDDDGKMDYVEISGYENSPISIDIPSEIDGLPVKSIGSLAFYDCTSLESITIPDSVEFLSSYVFINCSNLKSVVLPNNPKFDCISLCCFCECTSLENIVIPETVKIIGDMLFIIAVP